LVPLLMKFNQYFKRKREMQ